MVSLTWLKVRFFVPLNSMCSRKWAMPCCPGPSSREPIPTLIETAAERVCGRRSVITGIPAGVSVIVRSCSVFMGHKGVIQVKKDAAAK
jgi:hypothetical protein